MKVRNETERKANRRQIDRLRSKLASGDVGRNIGSTEAALDRRQKADLDYFRSAEKPIRTEQVQAQDVQQGDLIQMGTEQGRAFFREVSRVEVAEYQTMGRRVILTLIDTSPKGAQTMTDLLPFLTLTRVAV